MRIQFWGAAGTVTGSMHLLEVNGRRILLDCGLYQGRRKEAFERNRDLPYAASSIDAVVLSHAHIDHSGNLPSLVRAGFRGCIYSTSATRDLCAYMLIDSAHIQENDVKYVNKRRRKQGKKLFEPLYTKEDALETLKSFHAIDYDHSFEPLPGVTVRFRDAGHILGSAIVMVDANEKGKKSRLVFSGDIGRKGLPILRDPRAFEGADYVIMESTYGDRLHESSGDAKELLRRTVSEVIEAGGVLLIPAFAVGRTQEIVYRLNQLWEARELPPIDVFVDSPLAVNATDVFRVHPECYDEEYLEMMVTDSDQDPLCFDGLKYVRSADGSRALNSRDEPAVIISASGMCEGGRILHHLKHHATRAESIVLFVSFQAEHTLGRKIMNGKSPVRIYGEEYEMTAQIRRAEGYSAHADRAGLLRWASRVQEKGDVKHIFLVHGEPEGISALAAGLEDDGAADVQIPERGQRFDL
ncbi:MAG: MBL fold metallo-hydrolase [Gemmatimonadota bacterium]|nr:MAG: MBL fold metallo-hydrolase [Gemmatimonadota bacterium]